ncbi:MAG: two-component sensor histidine kinase [Cyanobacteria bacterium QS_8_64_29]|nr:MAG: two-component sensor histidine kinase [Cyanobacteria bacterium QS_8_64_29]
MFQTTRRRLALWYAAVTAVLLLLFATGIYAYVRSTLIERVDDTLQHVVAVVEQSLVVRSSEAPDARYRIDVAASFRDAADPLEPDRIDLEWFDPQGQRRWSTLSHPSTIPLHRDRRIETVRLPVETSGRLLRQVTAPVKADGQLLGYLRASHPWVEAVKPIRQLVVDLVAGASVTVLAVGAIGWWLSGLAIQPVRDSYQRLKQFTADASHELRNPIATIQTNIQTALAYTGADSELQQQQLQVVERLTQRLGRLVDDLLFLARSDSGTIQTQNDPVPLDALLMAVIEEQQAAAERSGVQLHFEPVDPNGSESGETFALNGDWDQLARLFTNLIGNAIEHAAGTDGTASAAPAVTVTLERAGRRAGSPLQVAVSDTGPGIPAEELPHLFERFYRRRNAPTPQTEASAGAGLGLAIARAIVANHGGQLYANSLPQQGTMFTVSLPATAPSAAS